MTSLFAPGPGPGSTAVVLEPVARTPVVRPPRTATPGEAVATPDSAGALDRPDGYVVFAIAGTVYAVPVAEVGAVVRPEQLELLPATGSPGHDRGVALVDVRGRAIPVVDLRADASRPGEVLLPLYRHHVGLVVDRVLAVRRADELVAEPDAMADLLPRHATGVLRAVDGSGHLLLVAMPELASFSP